MNYRYGNLEMLKFNMQRLGFYRHLVAHVREVIEKEVNPIKEKLREGEVSWQH